MQCPKPNPKHQGCPSFADFRFCFLLGFLRVRLGAHLNGSPDTSYGALHHSNSSSEGTTRKVSRGLGRTDPGFGPHVRDVAAW